MFWKNNLEVILNEFNINIIQRFSHNKKIVLIALLSAIAALLQSTGGFFPGLGYLISSLTTAPIIIATLLGIQYGYMSYTLTLILLILFQPSELIIFPFTTGLLGIAVGTALRIFKSKLLISVFSATLLFTGITVLLYFFMFPVLGPVVDSAVNLTRVFNIFLFSFLYAYIWVELILYVLRGITKMYVKKE